VSFDCVVLGNGLVGGAAALELASRGARVCLVGAGFGQEQTFSSHEDDSRLSRIYHHDAYWEELTLANLPLLDDLMQSSGLPIWRSEQVLYDWQSRRQSDWLVTMPVPKRVGDCRFREQDAHGGIIDPKLYVEALNQGARGAGAEVRRAVVRHVHDASDEWHVETSDGPVRARALVDARGLHSGQVERGRLGIVGKVFFFTESPACGDDSFCFIAETPDSAEFVDVYGFVGYSERNGRRVSKFGFSERAPLRLKERAEVSHWFAQGYELYPNSTAALKWLRAFEDGAHQILRMKPCAFTTTPDRRPRVEIERRRLSIAGCNGAAAKCCQALVARALERAELLQ